MGPASEVVGTLTYGPNVADNIAWMEVWGGWAMLAVAGVMALAAARELWPLVRLRLTPRNRLVPGRSLVEGVVENGAVGSPVLVEIDQERRHWPGSRLPDRYIERSRRVSLQPFVLRLDDGRRVRVVPDGQHVTLLCKLRRGGGFAWRTSTAKVSVGDRVLVEGEIAAAPSLSAPYREAAASDVVELRPLPELPLWVAVESEARSTMRRAATFYATLMAAMLVTCAVARYGALGDLRELAANGQVVDARIASVDSGADGRVLVRATLPDGQMVAAWMNPSFAPIGNALRDGTLQPGSLLRWTYVPTRPSLSMPGEMISDEPWAEVMIVLVWLAVAGALWIHWRSFRPWYRRHDVDETAVS